MRPMARIFALFAKNLVTMLAGIEHEAAGPYIELAYFPSEVV